jgi:malate dehydrogenase (oxaloacetate-decarboxylating)(NADP+)
MMVNEGDADGCNRSYKKLFFCSETYVTVGGYGSRSSIIATTNMMMTAWTHVLSDTAININPTANELAKIAIMTAKR